jgi:hypothetical protein
VPDSSDTAPELSGQGEATTGIGPAGLTFDNTPYQSPLGVMLGYSSPWPFSRSSALC